MNRPAPGMSLSIVIPALNESSCIEATLDAVSRLASLREIIVVDGGSSDDTVRRAAGFSATVITAPRGRGSQMRAGAEAATGDAILFLHADTLPPADASEQIAAALRDPGTVGGNFEIRFAGDFLAARFLTALYRYLAWLGLRYGDSGYFVRREAYEKVGGFRAYPIFEDLDLLRRLKRLGRFVRVDGVVTTSSRRFEGRSFLVIFLRWTFLQVLYWLGVSPLRLGRLYRHVPLPGTRSSPAPLTPQGGSR